MSDGVEPVASPPSYDEKDNSLKESSLEKGAVADYVVHADNSKFQFDAADLDRVQRRLKQRHVQMIAVREQPLELPRNSRA